MLPIDMTPQEIYEALAKNPPVYFQELISHFSPDPNANNDGVGFGRGVKMKSIPDKIVWTDCSRAQAFAYAEAKPGDGFKHSNIRIKTRNTQINEMDGQIKFYIASIISSSTEAELDSNKKEIISVLTDALKYAKQ